MPFPRFKGKLTAGINLFEPLDSAIWVIVLLFFIICASINGGDLKMAFMGAAGIVVVMFLVGASIEIIIESLRDIKGLGTLVGFITNGPEALCLIVGLIAGDILYAASTPLGSNIMNPLMLITAALITHRFIMTFKTYPGFSITCIVITACFAVFFFVTPENLRIVWLGLAVLVTAVLFYKRPPEPPQNEDNHGQAMPKIMLAPALLVLIGAGYFLDPVVSFTAEHARAPKGVIGFFILATLTSWPEFKSTLSLLRRDRPLAAILNITVSNITNIWLACIGIGFYLVTR